MLVPKNKNNWQKENDAMIIIQIITFGLGTLPSLFIKTSFFIASNNSFEIENSRSKLISCVGLNGRKNIFYST